MHRYLALLSCCALAACATTQPAEQQPRSTSARTGIAAVDTLYVRLETDTAKYNAGLDSISHGDTDAGRQTTAAAGSDMLDAAGKCQATPPCDSNRFIAAYDALLKRQASEIDNSAGFADVDIKGAPPGADVAQGGSPVIANLPAASRPVEMLKGRDLREIITLNEPMKAALTEWLTNNRAQLIDAWENYQYMRQLMWPEYQREGLPEALLFGIMAQESGGKVHAVSRSGAAGLLQFMPATGAAYGLGVIDGFDTRYDPTLSTRANVEYFNARFAELGNNLELAIAAYNGGEGRVARLYNNTGGKGFWDPDVYSQLPPETRDYVPRVLAAAWLFLNAKDYGLQFPRVNAGEPQMLTLARGTSINELTLCLGNNGVRDGWFRALRNLNPRYDPHDPIPAGTVLRVPPYVTHLYRENCIDNQARAQMAADLAAARKPTVIAQPPSAPEPEEVASNDRRQPAYTYTAGRGETLAEIADRKDCDASELARTNGIRASHPLRKGQKIKMVGCYRR
ncbi:MAG TPA: transglycosylase SLT domain-containing protein [Xanthomonadaceae bacterium]|nr:transglycosylase SLT domain-containing protein [Xanthomonadaceae bacterium]